MQRLTQPELRQLKELCKQQSYDAILALLQYHIDEGTEIALKTASDHRYHQGKVQALKDFLADIVKKPK